MDEVTIMNQVFSGGSAMAGLILIFLGGVLSSYESFEATAQSFVRSRYKLRGSLAFAGFACALVAASMAMLYNWFANLCCFYTAITTLVISFVIAIIMGLIAVLDIR